MAGCAICRKCMSFLMKSAIAYEKKKAGGKEFTYDDVKRKVQIRRGSYERNREMIESLILELNNTLFIETI